MPVVRLVTTSLILAMYLGEPGASHCQDLFSETVGGLDGIT